MRRWIEVWLEAIWLGIKQAAIRFATENPDAVIGGLIGLVSAIIRATGALVESGHAGLLFSFGRAKKVVSPGFQLLIPFLQIVRIMPVRSQTINLAAQQVTTLDGLVYDVDSILVYRISDVRKAFIEIDDLKKGMIQTLGLSVQEVLCTLERHSLKVSDSLNDTLAERMAELLAPWGVTVERAGFNSITPNAKTLRLTQLAQRVSQRRETLDRLIAQGVPPRLALPLLGGTSIWVRRARAAIAREAQKRRGRRLRRIALYAASYLDDITPAEALALADQVLDQNSGQQAAVTALARRSR